jgi:hydrogenase nickel incorporation protein HypA/HybF
MHEWALAEGIVATVLKTAVERDMQRVDKVVVRIGQLQQIEADLFAQSIAQVSPEGPSLLRDAVFAIEIEETALRFRICGNEFSPQDALMGLDAVESEAIHFIPELAHTFIHCPTCQSPDYDLVKGRGVSIARIEGV